MTISGSLVAAGFDAAVLEELPPEARTRLARVALLRLLAFAAIAFSAGYAAYVSFHGGLAGWGAGALSATCVWLLLSRMGRLLVSTGGPGVARGAAAAKTWQPSALWPTFMVVVALLAAQPLVLLVGGGGSRERLEKVIANRVALNLSRQRDVLVAGDNTLRLQRAQLAERLAAGGAPLPDSTRRRKALVIGAQQYVYANALNNPAKDARELSAKLTDMGFDVVVSIDEPADSLQMKVDRHIQSLQPGDVSLLAYSGHGFQREGHNYIVPVDFDGQRVGGIRVTRILEAINSRSPQLQVILLDACRSFESSGFKAATGGLAELQGGTNSFIAMAAQPGKEALDGVPGTNGLFTAAILRHIDRPEDINILFRRIKADVSAAARERDFTQEPVVTESLQSEYVQLVDPAIAAPQTLLNGDAGAPDAAGEDTLGLRRKSEVCPAAPGLAPEQQEELTQGCLRRRIEAIDSMLAEWREVGSRQLGENAAAYRMSLERSGLLRERLAELWSGAPAALALVSLLLAALLLSGELLHWENRSDVAAYFERRNHRAIQGLERSHARVERVVERRLAAVRHPEYLKLDRFRNVFDWKGPVATPPLRSADTPAPTRAERQAIDAWLKATARSPRGTS